MLSLDRVEGLLREKLGGAVGGRGRVRGVADSGWFLDSSSQGPTQGLTTCHDLLLCPPQVSLRLGMDLWRARLPPSCLKAHPLKPEACFFGPNLYASLKGRPLAL